MRLQVIGVMAAAAGLLLGGTGTASADPFAIAQGYNVFVLGNMTLSNTDVGGRVAVGGNGQFSNFAVGSGNNGSNGVALSADASRIDLLVGGHATLSNGSIQRGSAQAGSATQSGVGYPVAGASLTTGASSIDFAAAGTALLQESASLAGLTATGSVASAYSTLTLTGSDATLNVFSLSANDLLNISTLQLNAPTSSTVIVNVSGSSINLANMGMFLNGSQNSAFRQRVVWNFSQAQALSLSGLQFSGSILAPSAALTFQNGQINGQVITRSLNSTGEFHNFVFNGDLPDSTPLTPVPEPSTLLLTLGGALMGWRKLRRR